MSRQSSWIVLKFPKQCSNDISDYKGVIHVYRQLINAPEQDVLFDCGDMSFVCPMGVNILALLIQSLSRQVSRKIFFTPPNNNSCGNYLDNQGFYKEFDIQNNIITVAPLNTTVGLRRIKNFEPLYLEEIALWLNRNSDLPQEAINDAVKITLSEIINNVIDHSQSPIGCYVSAQAYPGEQNLMLSVADLGIGFLGTLHARYKNLKNDKEAIALAVQSGVSAKSRGGNAGAGLDILSDFLGRYAGDFKIISMDGVWHQSPDGIVNDTIPFSFPGTCITIILNNQKIRDIRL